ncbi:hypothetical protein G7Y89_g7751 [Cudoniella acicularis]|uniref:Major facilitator superfamily (MFS) profile domain-containing protein n=1 Tax=Cudoniella acicularis TaxID=354080 RepID=A0A8H4W191_9HELO|nr:hypothetical protein G7Y89_g7751 [Cudoniella acicularis]
MRTEVGEAEVLSQAAVTAASSLEGTYYLLEWAPKIQDARPRYDTKQQRHIAPGVSPLIGWREKGNCRHDENLSQPPNFSPVSNPQFPRRAIEALERYRGAEILESNSETVEMRGPVTGALVDDSGVFASDNALKKLLADASSGKEKPLRPHFGIPNNERIIEPSTATLSVIFGGVLTVFAKKQASAATTVSHRPNQTGGERHDVTSRISTTRRRRKGPLNFHRPVSRPRCTKAILLARCPSSVPWGIHGECLSLQAVLHYAFGGEAVKILSSFNKLQQAPTSPNKPQQASSNPWPNHDQRLQACWPDSAPIRSCWDTEYCTNAVAWRRTEKKVHARHLGSSLLRITSKMAEPKSMTSHQDLDVHHPEEALPAEHIDLNSNLHAKIRNPLQGIPHAVLLQQVQEFAEEKGMTEHVALLKKGALVAQDPANYEDITGEHALAPEEVDVLRNEVLHKWRQPLALYVTIVTCSIGAAVQGWDQTGSNGANLSFPRVFGIGDETSTRDTLLVGLVNSAPYIGSAFVGCWVSDPLNHYLGRRGTIFIAAVFCLLPVFGSALSQSWQQLFVCRLLLGFGMGAKGSTVPIYAAENSPASIRGALVMSWQLWTAFGIFLGTCANLAMVNTGTIAWRLQLGSAFIPAVPLLLFIYSCPESPRWCMKKNKYPQAFKSLLRLRNDPLQAARDLYYIHAQLQVEREIIGDSNYITRFIQLFTIPRVSPPFQALFASFGFGLINFLFAFPAIWTIDTFGRRALLLFTFPNMAWSLLAAGLCALIDVKETAHLALVAMFIYIFAMFYSPGEGPVPFAYSAEVFPLSHREVGMGWAVATCLFWACVLTMFLPLMLSAMGTTGVFCFYAGTNIVALIMIFLWVPETKQRTLEELDYIFAVPTRTHMHYQVFKALPWWINRWVFQRKGEVLEPLYQFDTSTDQDRIEALYAADKVRQDKRDEATEGSDIQVEGHDASSAEIKENL